MVRVCGDCMNILLEFRAVEIDTISLEKESINNLLTNMFLLDFTRWMKEKNGTKICKVEEANNDDYICSVMDEKFLKFIIRAI